VGTQIVHEHHAHVGYDEIDMLSFECGDRLGAAYDEFHIEFGARPHAAADADMAGMLVHDDGMGDCKALPGAAAHLFGREKGIVKLG
jgi:hypothetical protein